MLYLASDAETAALEVYGDRIYPRKRAWIAKSDWFAREFSWLTLPEVKVADLTFCAMSKARVDLASLAHRSRKVTHPWGAAVMNHPDGFHGLLIVSRFTGKRCLALFQMPGDPPPVMAGASVPFATHTVAAALQAEFAIALT